MNPLRERRREELARQLDRVLPGLVRAGARQVYVVGSFARGEVRPWSDLDLVVVAETSERPHRRARLFYDAADPTDAVDIVVYTPEEFASRRESNRFLRHALKQARLVYDAQ